MKIRFSKAIRVKLVVFFAIVISLQSSVKDFIAEVRLYAKSAPCKFASYDENFKTIRGILPKFSAVEYFSDKNGSELDKLEDLGLTRYALAPVIVMNTPEPRFILAHFHEPIDVEAFCAGNHCQVLHNTHNEIVLFVKKARP